VYVAIRFWEDARRGIAVRATKVPRVLVASDSIPQELGAFAAIQAGRKHKRELSCGAVFFSDSFRVGVGRSSRCYCVACDCENLLGYLPRVFERVEIPRERELLVVPFIAAHIGSDRRTCVEVIKSAGSEAD
jgi:hypothetical protein